MKKILINALAARQGGGQTYLLNLLNGYNNPEIDFYLIIHKNHAKHFSELPNVKLICPNIPEENLIIRFFWENFYLPWFIVLNKIDILFCPSGILPKFFLPKTCKYVTVSQNMLPFSPDQVKSLGGRKFRLKFSIIKYSQLFSFYMSDLIIFISQFAKDEILASRPLLREKSYEVVPHGIPDAFRVNSEEAPLSSIKERPYALYVSSFYEYKSHLEVIEAWDSFKQKTSDNLKLYFAGDYSTKYGAMIQSEVKKRKLENEIKFLGNVPYSQIPTLYKQAELIIFASQCENCPNILLESMASGRPIFCSNLAPMPEFAQDSVNYFNPVKPGELSKLLALYCNGQNSQQMKKGNESQKLSLNYTWKHAQNKTWGSILELSNCSTQ